MASGVAHPKSTGGGGFTFEDKVDAYYLACLLAGRAPLGTLRGVLKRVDFQVRVDRWLLDDVLLRLSNGPEECLCSLSVRSGSQFTGGRFDSQFVEAAWRQYLLDAPNPFVHSRDWLGIACPPADAETHRNVEELLAWAEAQDPESLATRVRTEGFGSKEKRALFESFACPASLRGSLATLDRKESELLSRVLVLDDFDFETDPSRKEGEAIDICRSVLASGSNDEAVKLWQSLCGLAAEWRPKSGFFDLTRLLDQLRGHYALRDYPHHEADWAHILSQTQANLAGIRDTIGTVQISRDKELVDLDAALSRSTVAVVLGPSGCGKSAIAKVWAQAKLRDHKIVWWDARSLDVPDFSAFEHALSLSHALSDLLVHASGRESYIIIDGLDRVFSDVAFRNLNALLQLLRLDVKASPWHLVLPCRPEEWERKHDKLAIPGGWVPSLVAYFRLGDLDPVWQAYPSLRHLTQSPRIRFVLVRPKLLDLIVRRTTPAAPTNTVQWTGESDLLDWFWETEIRGCEDGEARATFLKRLGQSQGDSSVTQTPQHQFSVADQRPVRGLVQDGICDLREERILFAHDLFGDWARQRVLLAEATDLIGFLRLRISSPLWHAAIRLYALHLLEKNQDVARWRQAVAAVEPEPLLQDLLVDAVVFAANSQELLETVRADLMANGGVLLRRLLRRFHHVATIPNPSVILFVRALSPGESITEAATWQRLPYWPYWPPMLRFLHTHLAEVVEAAPAQVANVANTWLRQGLQGWPFRREAAELGLACGELVLRYRRGDGRHLYVEEKVAEIAFKAALAGAVEMPDEVSDFALRACQRKEQPGGALTSKDEIEDGD
ncbi:MAG: hypothetical protein NTX87_02770 [Planctomycetota bacterium]|nr:hypothetical protein [Planctomycetota bacterium]